MARRTDHAAALEVLDRWPNLGVRLCTSGQVLREYAVVATRLASVNGLGLSLGAALGNVRAFRDRMRFLAEDESVQESLLDLLSRISVIGQGLHDANIVATMLRHHVTTLVTANSADFLRYGKLIRVRDLRSAERVHEAKPIGARARRP